MIRTLKKLIYVSLGVFLFIVGLNRFVIFSPGQLEHFSSTIAYPFLVAQRMVAEPITKWWQNYKSKAELEQIMQNYKQENENLQAQLIELKASHNYKEATQELTDFARRYTTNKSIIAQIILRNFDDQHHFFLIDAGSAKNITVDMVVVYKQCLVGRVTEVYPHYSKVTLITDKTGKVAAYCASNNVQGIHEGINTLESTRLKYVNHLATITNNDLILSSGEGLIFPRGFALGTIKNFKQDGLNYEIEVEPLLDLKKLDYCYVVQKGVILQPEQQQISQEIKQEPASELTSQAPSKTTVEPKPKASQESKALPEDSNDLPVPDIL